LYNWYQIVKLMLISVFLSQIVIQRWVIPIRRLSGVCRIYWNIDTRSWTKFQNLHQWHVNTRQ